MIGKFLRALDTLIATPVYLVLSPLNLIRSAKSRKSKRILVVRFWSLGESLLCLPAIKKLHDSGYKITVLCTSNNKSVFECQKFIDEIIVLNYKNLISFLSNIFSLRSKGFEYSIDFEPYTKISAVISYISGATTRIGWDNRPLLYTNPVKIEEEKHFVINTFNLIRSIIKIENTKSLVKLPYSRSDAEFVSKIIRKTKRPLIAIHPGSGTTALSRRWPEDRWVELVKKLDKKYKGTIFLIGGKEEISLCDEIENECIDNRLINLAGKMNINQLAAFLSNMNLVIATDSGPMHIACSMKAHTVGLFGPNTPERYGPYGKNCIGLRKETMLPCILPFRRKFPECKHEHINKIKVHDVIRATKEMIRK